MMAKSSCLLPLFIAEMSAVKGAEKKRRRKKIINTSLSQMHLVTCAGVLKKDDDILISSWFCLVSVLHGPMGLCRNAFTFHSFIKMYVHFFCLFYIHSFIHFLCPVLLHSGGAGVVPQLPPGVKAGSRHGQVASFVFRFSPKNVFKWQRNCPPFSVNISHTVTAILIKEAKRR